MGGVDPNAEDVALVVTAVGRELPAKWAEWPGGWPGEIEAALIDAVLSMRARYGSENTGVRGSTHRYRDACGGGPLDNLDRLAGYGADKLATVLQNQQLTHGVTKASAVVSAAINLTRAGVHHAKDVDPDSVEHRVAYTSVYGLSTVTWEYFTMLLGHPGVKADRWIMSFTTAAVGRDVRQAEAAAMVKAAAKELGCSPTILDHAIWDHARRPRRP